MKKPIYNIRNTIYRLRLRTWIALGIILVLSPIVIWSLYKPGESEAEWWNESWMYRKKITIDNDQVSGSTDLTDYPVMIQIADDTDLLAAQDDGDDIVFTDISGAKLDHEIEDYAEDGSGTDITAWVRIPTLWAVSGTGEDTVIYLYYGNPTAANQENMTEVWDDDYVLVQHLEETTTGATDFKDSTAYRNDSSEVIIDGTGSNPDATGKADGAVQFDGSNDTVELIDADSQTPTGDLTLEVWANLDSLAEDLGHPQNMLFKGGGATFSYYISQTNPGNFARFHWRNSSGTGYSVTFNDYTLSTGQWYYITGKYESGTTYVFVNGTKEGDTNTPTGTLFNGNIGLQIGSTDGLEETDGTIDEVRLSKSARSDDWITTTYNNINSPGTFFSVDSEEASPGPVAYWKMDEGADNTCSGGSNDICDGTMNRNDGAFGASSAAPAWQTDEACVYGKCLYFDGTDAVASVSNTVSDIKTVSFWARVPSTSTTEQLIDFNGTDYISSVSGTITVNGFGTETVYIDGVPNTTISADKWHHIAVTTSTATSGSAIKIGQINTDFGQAFIDEVKLYQYARSAAQIKVDYTRGAEVLGAKTQEWMSEGLVGYWKLNESSTGSSQVDRADSSGNGVTLTDNGTTASAGGKYGNGSEHVPANTEFLSTASTVSGVRSVSFWVNPDSNSNYYVSLTSSAYITSTSGTLSASGFSDPKIYVNGERSTTISADAWSLVTVTDTTAIDANQFYVGRQSTNYFDGTMDEVRLYNRVLSPAEIRNIYNWAPGPILYLPFDENTGTTTTYDKSGNGYNGTMGGLAEDDWEPGKFGSALEFDAANDYVAVTDRDAFSANYTNQLTVEAWIKPSVVSGTTYIVSKRASSNYEWHLNIASGYLHAHMYTLAGSDYMYAFAPTTISANEWHHVAFTADLNSPYLKLYVDGIQVVEDTSTSGTYENGTANVRVGEDANGVGDYDGIIDEVKIYDYVRSVGQIVEDMNAGHPTPGSPIGSQVAHWKFDDMSGSTAQDSGPNNQDLTLVNTPTWTPSGKLESALSFASASSEYGYALDSTALSITGSLTLSAWINPSSNSASTLYDIAGKWDDSNVSYLLTQYGDELRLYIDSESSYIETTSANLATGSWYYVAGVYDSVLQTMKIYVNGIEQATTSTTVPSSIGDDEGRFHVGASHSTGDDPSNFFNGVIDEVKLYNSALSVDQIKIDYNFGSAVNYSSGQVEADDLADGAGDPPVAYWKIDENTGTSAYDSSGNGNSGTLYPGSGNVPAWVPGKYGSALNFDGSDDSVDAGSGSTIDKAFDSGGTVSAWIYPETDGEGLAGRIIEKGATNGWNLYVSGLSGGQLYLQFTHGFDSTDGEWNTNNRVLTANAWNHVAVVYDNSSTSNDPAFYVNGVKITSINESATPSSTRDDDSGYDLYIGNNGNSGSRTFDGSIDEVKIWNYSLTPAQVAYDFNRGKPVGHWKFDECQGITAYDASGNGKNGTISLGATVAGTCVGSAGEAWYEGASGKINASLKFDGSDDYVYITNDSVHNMGSGDFTLSAWLKTSTSSTGNIVGKGSTYTTGKRYQMNINDAGDCASGKIKVEIDDNSTKKFVCSTSSSLNNNSWHHVVMTRGGNNLRLFIDGSEDANSPTDITGYGDIDSSRDFYIGAIYQEGLGIADHYSGLIDDVRLYNYALSATQVKNIYNGGAVRFW